MKYALKHACLSFIVACTWLLSVMAMADSGANSGSVWKVSLGEQYFFLGGTLHLLQASDHPLPSGYEKAYKQADVLIFETAIGALEDPATQMRLGLALMAKNGERLNQVLTPKTHERLQEFAKSRGMPMTQLEMFTASGVALVLASAELARLGYTADWGVEQTMNSRAVKDQKSLAALETVQQQIDMLSGLGKGKENELLLYTLDDMASLAQQLKLLKTAWRSGDYSQVVDRYVGEFKRDYPLVYQSLLLDRNTDWLNQFGPMMKSSEIEFVLVGAMHLIGEDGLLTRLEASGYKLQRL